MGFWDKKPNEAEVKDPPADGKPPEKDPATLIAESVAAALKPVADSVGSIAQRIDALEQNTRKPAPEQKPTEVASVLDDENAAFAQRLTPIVARQLELEARMVKADIKAEYAAAGFGDLWDKFRADIDSTIDGSALVDGSGKILRGSPDYIRNCVDMIFGRAARQAGMRFDGKNKSFFLESASGDAGGHPAPEVDGLTADQRKVFNRMNVPLDRAKAVLGKLKFVQ